MKNSISLLIVLLAAVASVHAQTTDKFFARAEGNWKTKGTNFGMPSDVSMSWTPAVRGKFYQLQYTIVMHPAGKNDMVFEGVAYYKSTAENTYQATWFDSNGSQHPITAAFDGTSLTSRWGTKETELGKTTYRFLDNTRMEVIDSVQTKAGPWREFGRNILAKQ